MQLLHSLPIIVSYLALFGVALISQTGPKQVSLRNDEDQDWDS